MVRIKIQRDELKREDYGWFISYEIIFTAQEVDKFNSKPLKNFSGYHIDYNIPRLYISYEVEILELFENNETIEDRIALIEADIDDILWKCLNNS